MSEKFEFGDAKRFAWRIEIAHRPQVHVPSSSGARLELGMPIFAQTVATVAKAVIAAILRTAPPAGTAVVRQIPKVVYI